MRGPFSVASKLIFPSNCSLESSWRNLQDSHFFCIAPNSKIQPTVALHFRIFAVSFSIFHFCCNYCLNFRNDEEKSGIFTLLRRRSNLLISPISLDFATQFQKMVLEKFEKIWKQFEKVGGFNEKLFLFWEEIDLCRRFRSKKLSVIITPKSKAEHRQNKSSDSNFQNFLIKTYYHEYSPLVYFNVQTFSFFYLKRMMKYLFRGISYLVILNLKKSLIYFLRLSASIRYFVNLKFSSTK